MILKSKKLKKTRKLLIKILIEMLINTATIVGFVCTFPNIKELLCFIGLNVCFKVMSDQILGSKKEINEKIKDLNGNSLFLKELIENLQEEEKNLEKKIMNIKKLNLMKTIYMLLKKILCQNQWLENLY